MRKLKWIPPKRIQEAQRSLSPELMEQVLIVRRLLRENPPDLGPELFIPITEPKLWMQQYQPRRELLRRVKAKNAAIAAANVRSLLKTIDTTKFILPEHTCRMCETKQRAKLPAWCYICHAKLGE